MAKDITPLIVPKLSTAKGDLGLNGPMVESNLEKKSNAEINSGDETIRNNKQKNK